MASVTVYDQSTGQQYSVEMNIYSSVLTGSDSGAPSWYVSTTTAKRTAHGEQIKAVLVTDITGGSLADGTLTGDVQDSIAEIMERVRGRFNSSSSSSSSTSSVNSSSSSLNSSSSSSSSSESSTSESSTSESSTSESSTSESSTVALTSSSSSVALTSSSSSQTP